MGQAPDSVDRLWEYFTDFPKYPTFDEDFLRRVRPHMVEFKKYADPSEAEEPLMIAISATCDAIKEFTRQS